MKKQKQKKQKKTRGIARTIIRSILLLLVIAIAVVGIKGFSYVKSVIAKAPNIEDVDFSPKGFATYTVDTEGNQVQELVSADANRVAVSINDIPECMQQAIVVMEDERFYQHNGVDIKGIIRAGVEGVKNGMHFSQGASTITQQLLKNNVFLGWTEEQTMEDRVTRKIQEQYLAIQLEKKLNNKALILENYLNTINFGAGTYGVASAAEKYFGKNISEITISEAAVLSAIPQNPSRYNPIRFPEENNRRKEQALDKLLAQGYISEKEYKEAKTDPVYDRIADVQKNRTEKTSVYSYFTDALVQKVIKDLQEQKGYSEDEAYRLVYSGGLRIYTTQDMNIQKVCDEEYANPENFPENLNYSLEWYMTIMHANGEFETYDVNTMDEFARNNGVNLTALSEKQGEKIIKKYKKEIMKDSDTITEEHKQFIPQPQSSVIVIDQKTGYVKAIVGGRGEKTGSLTLNRATGTKRQPGSTFKILSAYAEAIDTGKMTIGTKLEDAPYNYKNKKPVHNADGVYHGNISIREAIKESVNVVAVKVLTQMTEKKCLDRVKKFGITSLDDMHDTSQALVLGGIRNGVSNIELTAAYASLANGGEYIEPIYYTKIVDHDGNTLLSNQPKKQNPVSKETAWILTDAMKDVVSDGTGKGAQPANGMPVAGKTGTTSDSRDLWFVGYSPYYTMGIWAGCDNNDSMPDTGEYKEFHKKLWGSIMNRLTENEKIKDFKKPDSVVQMPLCSVSAKLPTDKCKDVNDDYISKWFVPTDTCQACIW